MDEAQRERARRARIRDLECSGPRSWLYHREYIPPMPPPPEPVMDADAAREALKQIRRQLMGKRFTR